jgi:C4-dicarboxylate-specific signal transduction histidine kinase
LNFVNAYRNLTRIPTPNFAWVKVTDIMQNIQTLLLPELEKRGIEFESITTDKNITIQADAELIEQVLINLIKNAMEALEGCDAPRIAVIATQTHENRTLIQVKDNGGGIDDEFVNQIFIPFFTTKKKGSGIGLSLSRQIMQLHKGSISVQTSPKDSPEGGTAFTLSF